MKYLYLITFILFTWSSIYAKANETILENDIYVGDTIHYEIQFDPKEVHSIKILEGQYPNENEAQFLVFGLQKFENKISALCIFYKPGKYKLPFSWIEAGIQHTSSIEVQVLSQLIGDEMELEDITPPLPIQGPYAHKIFLLILFILFNLYIIFAIYIIWKRKPKYIDAIWEKQKEMDLVLALKIQIEKALEKAFISEKDLAFLISQYLKQKIGKDLNLDLSSKTDSEFLEFVYHRSFLGKKERDILEKFFIQAKYQDNQTILEQWNAKEQTKKIFSYLGIEYV